MDFLQFNPGSDFKLLLAVPLIPLVGYVVQIFFGRRLPRGAAGNGTRSGTGKETRKRSRSTSSS